VDEQREPDQRVGRAEPSLWRVNGVPSAADQPWSSAGAALEPPAEPLALLAHPRGMPAGGVPSAGTPEPDFGAVPQRPRHRYAPGLDDDTPPQGVPTVEAGGDPGWTAEPPLWREAVRSAPRGLPQRVPAEPDVPVSEHPDPVGHSPTDTGSTRDRWTAPELAWIADRLRRDDVPEAGTSPLDVDAVVAAVRDVPGVRAASVRSTPTGGHTLRLDLADDADPGQVSRSVARLLLERMGLSTEPQVLPQVRPAPQSPPRRLRSVPPPPEPPPAPPEQPESFEPPDQRTSPTPPGLHLTPPPPPPPAPPPLAPPAPPPPLAPPEHGEQRFAPPSPETPQPEPAESFPPPEPRASLPPHPPSWSEPAWLSERDELIEPVPFEPSPPFEPPERPGAPEPDELAVDDLSELPLRLPEEEQPEVVSRPLPVTQPAPRVLIDQVQVSTVGLEATVEVQLTAVDRRATGVAAGPAVDSYLVRLAAIATAKAIDGLLRGVAEPGGPSRCFIEHTGLVAFGSTEVAVAVVLLVCGGWVEQLSGSALVDGDPRQAMVRATLGAVNRRLEALLD
jgi:hypothetical protein